MHTVVDALNALEAVVKRSGVNHTANTHYLYQGEYCLIGAVWSHLGVEDEVLTNLVGTVKSLHENNSLPFPMTLGAVIVYHFAQRTQDQFGTWGEAFDKAISVAMRYLDLLPDKVLTTV